MNEKGEYLFIPVKEVEWIEAEGNYVRVHADTGVHLIRSSMNEMETVLNPRHFLRVHRGSIVNLNRVKGVRPESPSAYTAVLQSGHNVKVGRTYRDVLLQREG